MEKSVKRNSICALLAVTLVYSSLLGQQNGRSGAPVGPARVHANGWTSHPFYFGADYYPEDYSLELVECPAAR